MIASRKTNVTIFWNVLMSLIKLPEFLLVLYYLFLKRTTNLEPVNATWR